MSKFNDWLLTVLLVFIISMLLDLSLTDAKVYFRFDGVEHTFQRGERK